jgi:mannose-6-phosphate isomerase
MGPISQNHPNDNASADEWVSWFWDDFFPQWIERATDADGIGFFDFLDVDGHPPKDPQKTVLAQARLLFTFSHLALISGNPMYHQAARVARAALPYFRKPSGLYRRGVHRNGQTTDDSNINLASSYDQSFLILSLSTWGKLDSSEDVSDELETLWAAIQSDLIDTNTGMFLEHDNVPDPAHSAAPMRAQNPHMHMFEAALQAFEMTGQNKWMDRAQASRAKGIEYFFDTDSGTITEFLAPNLSVLDGRDGERREIGHQCEWAWLLMREVDLGGDPAMTDIAKRLLNFADAHGFANDGVMRGAAFDAVSANTDWREDAFLLWPQTEAIKTYAVRSNNAVMATKAQALVQVIFKQYFADRAAFVNQLDTDGNLLWSEGLSRLHYHLVLALTEGARANLWAAPH